MIRELRHIHAFLEVARRGSFTRAAAELRVSQPALTVQASVEHSRERALAALEKNPLVGQTGIAQQVLEGYMHAFGEQMKLLAA